MYYYRLRPSITFCDLPNNLHQLLIVPQKTLLNSSQLQNSVDKMNQSHIPEIADRGIVGDEMIF